MAPSSKGTAPVIAALGATQIIGYGSLYYAFAILAPQIAAEFQVSEAALFAVLSAGLLLGGMTAPVFGHWMDRLGAPVIMSAGSALMALLLVLLAFAPGVRAFAALLVLIEALSFMVLYDAAFTTLARAAPGNTRAAITNLTLIAGFASTIFWPLTGWLGEAMGWRNVYLVFAGLHLGIALPLHLWILRRRQPTPGSGDQPAQDDMAVGWRLSAGSAARRAFWLLGIGFALTGMAIAAITVHMVPVLLNRGMGEAAYLVAMAMGPAQVLIRLVDANLWRRRHPVVVALIAAGAIPLGLAMLLLPGSGLAPALGFALLIGTGGGLSSIVRGSVPVVLFGTAGLGLRLGQLAAMRTVLGAAAPALFAFAAAALGIAATLAVTLAIAAGGFAVMLWLWLELRVAAAPVRPGAAAPPPTS
jgi:MFS family permease